VSGRPLLSHLQSHGRTLPSGESSGLLAKADDHLDDELCELAYRRVQAHEKRLRTSGMFGAPVLVSDSASTRAKLLGLFGRDPNWQPTFIRGQRYN
jgi:hypothetical protein